MCIVNSNIFTTLSTTRPFKTRHCPEAETGLSDSEYQEHVLIHSVISNEIM